MDDYEFLDYCRWHCKTPRALFHASHIARLHALAGQVSPVNGKLDVYLSMREDTAFPLVEAARKRIEEPLDIAVFADEKYNWSKHTFGTDLPIGGIIAHIHKEAEEALAKPEDLEEWVDLIFLALDGASRNGFTGKQIAFAMRMKMEKNMRRKWERQEAGHFEHTRSGE